MRIGTWIRAALYASLLSGGVFLLLVLAITGEWPRWTQGRALFIVPLGILSFAIGFPGCFIFLLFLFDGLLRPERAPNLISRSIALGLAASVLNGVLSPLMMGALSLLTKPRSLMEQTMIVALAACSGPAVIVEYVWIRSRWPLSQARTDLSV